MLEATVEEQLVTIREQLQTNTLLQQQQQVK
jgi:hypothetical protein